MPGGGGVYPCPYCTVPASPQDVGLPGLLRARFLSFQATGQGPSTRQKQRGLYGALMPLLFHTAPGRLLFILCCNFNGQKLCPLAHCRDTNIHSPQGLLSCPTAQGERPRPTTKG